MKVQINMGRVAADIVKAMPRREAARRILAGIGPAAFAAWVTFAQNQLRSTSRTYVQGLQMEPGDFVWKIHLTGQIPNMVERGWPGGDMKRWMLGSSKAKQGQNGPYLDIPFRHGTPGTGGRNVGTSMPAAIHAVAKKLTPTIPGGGASRLDNGMRRLVAGGPGVSKRANAILNTITKPSHSASIYQGMVRNATMTPKGPKTSGFMTFRRISPVSKAWQHGGIKARNIAPQVQKYVNMIAKAKIAEALK